MSVTDQLNLLGLEETRRRVLADAGRFAADRLAFRPVQHKLLIVLCAVVLLLYMTAITWLFPNPALAKFSVR